MALPKHLQSTFLPSELSFMAENETISIIPRQQLDELKLIGGTIRRMRPPQRSEVPIWLALLLKRQKRATVVPPAWLSIEELEQRLEEEKKIDEHGENAGFSPLPFRWVEVSDLLLDVAADDIPDSDLVRRLLRDLRETRQAKARDGLEVLEDRILQMDNIGLTEINEIRAIFSGSMDVLRQLQDTKVDDEQEDDNNNNNNFANGGQAMQVDDDSDG